MVRKKSKVLSLYSNPPSKLSKGDILSIQYQIPSSRSPISLNFSFTKFVRLNDHRLILAENRTHLWDTGNRKRQGKKKAQIT